MNLHPSRPTRPLVLSRGKIRRFRIGAVTVASTLPSPAPQLKVSLRLFFDQEYKLNQIEQSPVIEGRYKQKELALNAQGPDRRPRLRPVNDGQVPIL